jgi:subtilisin family serine protease
MSARNDRVAQFHGTFTMSEMVGDDEQGNQVAVAPVPRGSHAVTWISTASVLPPSTASVSTGRWPRIPWASHNLRIAMAPDVVSNSWDCPAAEGCNLIALSAAVLAVRTAGISEAMAAGNYGSACSTVKTTPSIFAASVSVGATDSYNNIAPFSSRGPVAVDNSNRLKPELLAPGLNIRGAIAYTTTSYQNYWSGTSMAAPHVAPSPFCGRPSRS